MCINKLAETVNEYNNTYHSRIKMKPAKVKPSTYIDFGAENNDKNSKFKVANHARISKYNNIFCKRLLSRMPRIYVISEPNGEKIVKIFNKKELKKTNQLKFRLENVIRRKGDKLYVKWEKMMIPLKVGLIKKNIAKKK